MTGSYCLLELPRCNLAVPVLVGMSSSLQREAEVDRTGWVIDARVPEPWGQRSHSTFHSADLGTVLEEHSRYRSRVAVEGIGSLVAEGRAGLSNNRHYHLQNLEGIRRKDRGWRQ